MYDSDTWTTGTVRIAGQVLSDAVAISAGEDCSLAIKADGVVVGWGANQFGRAIGVGASDAQPTNGLVALGGQLLRGVASVSAGGGCSLAVLGDGKVAAWGQGDVPAALNSVRAIASRGPYCLALRSNGTLVGWTSAPWAVMDVPKDLSNVVAIAVGSRFLERSMALKKDGTVVVWRAGEPHHEEIPAGVTNVVAIAAGKGHSLALKKDGTVFGWGDNSLCQAIGVPIATGFAAALVTVGGQTLSNVVAIAAAGDYSLALKADGTVVAWGGDKRWFAEVPAGLTGVTAISAGENHCLAITTNRSPTVLKR